MAMSALSARRRNAGNRFQAKDKAALWQEALASSRRQAQKQGKKLLERFGGCGDRMTAIGASVLLIAARTHSPRFPCKRPPFALIVPAQFDCSLLLKQVASSARSSAPRTLHTAKHHFSRPDTSLQDAPPRARPVERRSRQHHTARLAAAARLRSACDRARRPAGRQRPDASCEAHLWGAGGQREGLGRS